VSQAPVPGGTRKRWRRGKEDSMYNKVNAVEENQVMDRDKNTQGEKQR